MEQNWLEFAFRRLVWVVLRELHEHLVNPSLPRRAFLARNFALPFEQVLRLSVSGHRGLCCVSKRMLFPPVLPLLHKPCFRNTGHQNLVSWLEMDE